MSADARGLPGAEQIAAGVIVSQVTSHAGQEKLGPGSEISERETGMWNVGLHVNMPHLPGLQGFAGI